MTDAPPPERPAPSPPLRPASPIRRTAGRAARAGVSVIWAVPILALLVTLALAWNAYTGRGTLVSVAFGDATGITPGETALKFREITVGKVEAVRFTKDLQRVVVDLRVDKGIAEFIDDDAEFWIVRPQVSAQGISRLDTVLTGAFIEGWWDDKPGSTDKAVHDGLDRAPLTRSNEKGTWYALTSNNAKGMTEGAPIFYRGLAVGRMQNLRLAEGDERVIADVFIESPHDQRLTTATAFWDTSGFSVSLGPQGVALNVQSVSSLVQGGAEFATLSSGGQPVEPGHVFELQPDEQSARKSLFTASPDQELRLSVLLPDAVRGLAEGADVQFQGLTVGRVTGLSVRVAGGAEGQPRQVLQDITIAVSPQRLGLADNATPADALAFLSERVAQGLRARISGSGFLGTSLIVELVDLPSSSPAQIAADAQPFPVIPAAPADSANIAANAQGLMNRIGNLKIEELLKSASDMMDSITAVASSQDTRALPGKLGAAVDKVAGAAGDIGTIAADLKTAGVGPKIGQFADDAAGAAKTIREAAVNLPKMVDSIDAAATSLDEFDWGGISGSAKGVIDDVRAMLGTEDAAQLPRNLSDTLKAASGLLNDLRSGNAAGNLNAALASARRAMDQVAQAANSLPQLSARFQALAARADGVIGAYGERGTFNIETLNAIRSLRRAADNLASLAATIERNPRAFILGR
ncbi:intermembrane transport protein PqiB [Paracoccus contaminans]|uniref:Paraquat-inducible protein B n=1 Tax=Paracoccus contaminans TaxID=1945662 RepID=A0A1W6D0W9_9RHOB|nr:MlaD family protein [Paracoccus contaminans]ARJ70757.1 paraquat-inducible protein B [Paracoccus contaminans]